MMGDSDFEHEDEEEKDPFNEQQSDFAILKHLVEKFSKNHHSLLL
jgi:hypothetical protein